MSLRARLAMLVAACVAAAVIAVSFLAYYATENRLVSAVDDTLEARASFESSKQSSGRPDPGRGPGGGEGAGPRPSPGLSSIDIFQIIDSDGNVLYAPSDQDITIPVSDDDVAVATGEGEAFFRNETIDGTEYRVYSAPAGAGAAVVCLRSLDEVNSTLTDLRNILFVVSLGGVAVAAGLGLIVAQRALRPVARLTEAAEHVAATQDLSHSIDADGSDEIGRLGASFNTMLRALDASREQQRRLVTDASHELRTPLTSLRTNVELLAKEKDLDPDEQRQMLADAVFEIDELTKIVGELVDLATDPRSDARVRVDVRLDEVVDAVVERARRRSGLRIEVDAEPTLVVGNPELLERAVSNLVDNACKWSPPDQHIDVTVRDGRVEVRDHGPGIPVEDLPYVFDRFYRSPAARARPGSGLGLAIVKQIIEAHGGVARIDSAAPGGTRASFSLPTAELG